ncbi:hypothetical protein BH09GEM1_BH09GEM1_28640 [soil metagenome]
MTDSNAGACDGDSLSAGAWMSLYEDLLAGLVHSMNNTLTVLGMSLELATPDEPPDIPGLRRELGHVERLTGLAAILSSRSTREEALEPRAALEVALAIHALNSPTRAVECVIRATGPVAPVRVARPVLTRTLLLMIDGAKRAKGTAAAPVPIEISGDEDRVIVRAPLSGHPSRDALAFASSCGASLTVQDGYAVLELPSLQRLRSHNGVQAPLRETAMLMPASGS